MSPVTAYEGETTMAKKQKPGSEILPMPLAAWWFVRRGIAAAMTLRNRCGFTMWGAFATMWTVARMEDRPGKYQTHFPPTSEAQDG